MGILKNKWFILGNVLLLLVVIPITLFVVKQQSDLRSKAAPTTTLSFTPSTATIGVGETASFDVFVNPGQNVVSILEMTVSVDTDSLEIVSFEPNQTAFPVTLKGPTIDGGTVTLAVSTSNDITKAVQTNTKVATLVVKGKAITSAPSVIAFDTPSSQAFSLASTDGETENVLSDATTASVTVAEAGTISPTPTGEAGGETPGATPSASPSPTANVAPACTALTLDKSSTGAAPYAIIFTATGSDNGGNISKASFNFGDGPVMDVTTGGGLGTGAVNVQIAHTFATPGTYNVTATLTDDGGLTSSASSCTQTVTITQGATAGGGTGGTGGSAGGGTGGTGGSAVPTLPVTGTLETALMVGGAATVAIIVGVFLFLL